MIALTKDKVTDIDAQRQKKRYMKLFCDRNYIFLSLTFYISTVLLLLFDNTGVELDRVSNPMIIAVLTFLVLIYCRSNVNLHLRSPLNLFIHIIFMVFFVPACVTTLTVVLDYSNVTIICMNLLYVATTCLLAALLQVKVALNRRWISSLALLTSILVPSLLHISRQMQKKNRVLFWLAFPFILAFQRIHPLDSLGVPIVPSHSPIFLVLLFGLIAAQQVSEKATKDYYLSFNPFVFVAPISAFSTAIAVYEFGSRQCERIAKMLTIPESVIITLLPFAFIVVTKQFTSPGLLNCTVQN